jgi:hypothetical protein
MFISWAPGAHTCNLSYSGGRDQENHSSRPAQEKKKKKKVRPYLKNTQHKRGLAKWFTWYSTCQQV